MKELVISSADYPPLPLSPVLPWCRDRIKKLNEEELEAFLAPLSLSIHHLFMSYFSSRPPQQGEEIYFSEKEYRRRLIYHDLMKIFVALTGEDYRRIHLILEGNYTHNSRKILNYLDENMNPAKGELTVTIKGDPIPWDGLSRLPLCPYGEGKDDLDQLKLALLFRAFGDHMTACQLFDRLYVKAREGRLDFDVPQRATLFFAYGKSALELNLSDTSLTLFASLMNLGKAWRNGEYISEAYRMTGEVYRRNGFDKAATRFFLKAREESDGDRGTLHRFRCLFSLMQSGNVSHLSSEEEKEAEMLARERGYHTSLGFIYLYQSEPDFAKALALFRSKGNTLLLAETYYRRALASESPEETEADLKTSLSLGEELNNLRIMLQARFSLGKLYLEKDRPMECFSLFRQALEDCLKTEEYGPMASIYHGLAHLAFREYQPDLCRTFLENSNYILERLPHRSTRLQRDNARLLEKLNGENLPPTPRPWLSDPLDREIVSSSLKQYRRVEQLRRKMHEINLLSEVQTLFSQRLAREILLLQTMERLLTSFLVNTISYYEKMKDSYRLAYHSSTFDDPPDRELLKRYLALGGQKEKMTTRIIEEASDDTVRSLGVPIFTDSRLDGIILCRLEDPVINTGANDIQFFTLLGGQFGIALEHIKQRDLIIMKNRQLEEINKKLTKTTLTDPLTGVGNRMLLTIKMKEFAGKYGGNREGDNFSLLFIDLDFFKFYNDNYGHVLGDRLLNEFADLLRSVSRESDGIFRYGGDEFILLLAGIDSAQAVPIADRILDELEKRGGFQSVIDSLLPRSEPVPRDKWLSCSLGISDFLKAGKQGDELLEQADKAVYQAKELGKKRWIIYEGDMNHE